MPKQPMIEWKKFSGIRNTGFPTGHTKAELIIADNVDITADNKIWRRYGKTRVISGAFHSLFSDGSTCLAVKDEKLIRIFPDYSYLTILLDAGKDRMSYVSVNGTIYYTNYKVIGYVQNGQCYEFQTPTHQFKRAPLPGQLIEYYRGCLYIARDNILWFTDALAFNSVDMRKNFKQFPSRILMVRAVDDGMYVSDSKSTYFLSGNSPTEFALKKIFDYPAILGTDTASDGQSLNREYQGRVALWAGERGVCIGMNGGQALNATDKKYLLPFGIEGASIARIEELKQFVVAINPRGEGADLIIKEEIAVL